MKKSLLIFAVVFMLLFSACSKGEEQKNDVFEHAEQITEPTESYTEPTDIYTEPTETDTEPAESITEPVEEETEEVTTSFEDYMNEIVAVVREWMANREYKIYGMYDRYHNPMSVVVDNEEDIAAIKERLLSMGYTEEAIEALNMRVGEITPA